MKKVIKVSGILLLSILAVLVVNSHSAKASAATITWSGGNCTSNTCNWSDSGNWAGGVVPSSGDNLIFDNSSLTNDQQTVDDIASSVTPANVTLEGNTSYSIVIIPVNNDGSYGTFTMNGNLTDSIVSGSAILPSGIYGGFVNSSSSPTYTIGDAFNFGEGVFVDPNNSTVKTASFSTGTATFTGTGDNTDIINYDQVIGSHTLNLELSANGDWQQLATSSSFTGTINVSTGTLDIAPYLSPVAMPDVFSGANLLNISSGASLVFQDPSAASKTIAEPIKIAGTGNSNCSNNNSSVNCGSIFADIDPTSNLTFSGNITLTSNTQINTTGTVTLTGTLSGPYSFSTPFQGLLVINSSSNSTNTPNGSLGSLSNQPGSGGSNSGNGSSGSTSGGTNSSVPGTPNTGIALHNSNPLFIIIATTACSISLLVLSQKTKKLNY
jgi:hypothetical protein